MKIRDVRTHVLRYDLAGGDNVVGYRACLVTAHTAERVTMQNY